MSDKKLHQLGVGEAGLSAACWALAGLRDAPELRREFARLADEHRAAAETLGARGARMHEVLEAARALVQAALEPGGTIGWLREREHRLIRNYLALDTISGLDDATRRRLRRELLPAAYDRYTRVDRLLVLHEADAVPA
jgi:hypothetical protein